MVVVKSFIGLQTISNLQTTWLAAVLVSQGFAVTLGNKPCSPSKGHACKDDTFVWVGGQHRLLRDIRPGGRHLNDTIQGYSTQWEIREAFFPLPSDEGPRSTHELLRSLRPCKPCKRPRRYGEGNDGGYVLCEEDLKHGGLLGVYSFGIHGYDGFGEAVADQLKAPLYEYDCYDWRKPRPELSHETHFHKECLQADGVAAVAVTATDGIQYQYKNLSVLLTSNGQMNVKDSSLVLKIDIESYEWTVLASMSPSILRKFRSLVVEFHNLDEVGNHKLYLSAITNILKSGFRVAHIHGNNFRGMACFGEIQWFSPSGWLSLPFGGCLREFAVPTDLEVTFVYDPVASNSFAQGASKCPHSAALVSSLPEDAKNNFWALDLPTTVLPTAPYLHSALQSVSYSIPAHLAVLTWLLMFAC